MRQLQASKSNEQFQEWVLKSVKPKLEKGFDIEAISLLPYGVAPVQDSKKLTELASDYSKAANTTLAVTGSSRVGLNLSKSLSLKHTRGGRHTINGVDCECIRISVVGISNFSTKTSR